jgi:hypothetical protein
MGRPGPPGRVFDNNLCDLIKFCLTKEMRRFCVTKLLLLFPVCSDNLAANAY